MKYYTYLFPLLNLFLLSKVQAQSNKISSNTGKAQLPFHELVVFGDDLTDDGCTLLPFNFTVPSLVLGGGSPWSLRPNQSNFSSRSSIL